MLYRTIAALIVIFWVTMTALLIRSELSPADARLREVPVSHVVKLIFAHEQPSELSIFNDKLRLGQMRVHPAVRALDGARVVDFSGNLHILLPGATRQRVTWDGTLELTRTLDMQSVRFALTFREEDAYRFELVVRPPEKVFRYSWNIGGGLPDEREFTLDEAGMRAALAELEVDPTLLGTMRTTRNSAPPEFTARISSLKLHGEKVDTYLVAIRMNGQTLIEMHISQLGQVLTAKSLIGYTLAPDDFMP
jgi:hypothetical protein